MNQDQTLAKLKKEVRSLLLSSNLGLSVEELRRDYLQMLGHRMPLKDLGFLSILDMAMDMPDVVSLCYLADGSLVLKVVTDESTRGIKELVSRQRVDKPKNKRVSFHKQLYPRPMVPIILPRWGRAPPALPAHVRAQMRQLLSQGPLRLSELESRFQKCFGQPLRFTDYGFYSLGDMLARVQDLSIKYTRRGSIISLKQPDQPNRRRACSSQPPAQGLEPCGSGFTCVVDNGPQAPDPEPQQPDQDGQQLEKFMFELEVELHQKILENSDAGSVSPELKAKLQKVVGDSSQGLSVHNLPTQYKRVFGEELPLLQSGFLSVTELVAALSDLFHLEPAGGAHDPHWIVKNIHSTVETAGPAVPADAVRGQRLRSPTGRAPRALGAVLVEQVESPSSFHVRFSESQEARSLEYMMLEMRSCYIHSKVSARYRLPARYLRRGQVCCVAPQDLWFYRVVVHRVVSPDQAEVYYVDFGNLNLVSMDKLMFLKSCYAQLPVQAVPAMLTGDAWSTAATASFQELCRDRTLVAVLHGYHGDVLQLFLCDTRTEEDHYVHSVLQAQGHAHPCPPDGTITTVSEEETLPELEPVEVFDSPLETLNLLESSLKRIPCGAGQQTSALEDWRPPSLPEPAGGPQPTEQPSWGNGSQCTGNHANTRPGEESRPAVHPGPAVTPDPHGAWGASPSPVPPTVLISRSLLTPGLAKDWFYGLPGAPFRSPGRSMVFPLFGGRDLATVNTK
ncbi:hypothetical protein NHX12_032891 [Muraenolepis orangiensis]|uniref:Tudor domain-containing protein 5 n=1 Tax=Muraenolepis orangiensis TaxID=630683 RepID=A0A9Q0E2X1_9TELE|nr:hypothetical protein NHX12_032891 [Muraenolepis orangiensis]